MEAIVAIIEANEAAFSLTADILEAYSTENLGSVIKAFKGVSFFLGPACIVLDLVSAFLPDQKQEAIMRALNKLQESVDSVRDDIKNLEKSLKWEANRLKYLDVCNLIKTAYQFCLLINKHKNDKKQQKDCKDRLRDLCSNQDLTLAINLLMDGMAGTGTFKVSILDSLYAQNGGNRGEIGEMCARLNQLLFCGIVSVLTYETLERGAKSAKTFEQDMFSPQMKGVLDHQSVALKRCKDEFQANMKEDLRSTMDQCQGTQNRNVVNNLYWKISKKYDWLNVCCLVYGDIKGYNNHCYGGSPVSILHQYNKCGIIYFRDKNKPTIGKDRSKIIDKANSIAHGSYGDAQASYSAFSHAFPGAFWGLWVGKRYIDLQASGCIDVWVVGKKFTVCAFIN